MLVRTRTPVALDFVDGRSDGPMPEALAADPSPVQESPGGRAMTRRLSIPSTALIAILGISQLVAQTPNILRNGDFDGASGVAHWTPQGSPLNVQIGLADVDGDGVDSPCLTFDRGGAFDQEVWLRAGSYAVGCSAMLFNDFPTTPVPSGNGGLQIGVTVFFPSWNPAPWLLVNGGVFTDDPTTLAGTRAFTRREFTNPIDQWVRVRVAASSVYEVTGVTGQYAIDDVVLQPSESPAFDGVTFYGGSQTNGLFWLRTTEMPQLSAAALLCSPQLLAQPVSLPALDATLYLNSPVVVASAMPPGSPDGLLLQTTTAPSDVGPLHWQLVGIDPASGSLTLSDYFMSWSR